MQHCTSNMPYMCCSICLQHTREDRAGRRDDVGRVKGESSYREGDINEMESVCCVKEGRREE